MQVLDQTKPSGRWSFDTEVTACFDDMLARSVPQYQTMREASFELGKTFVQPGTAIVDLGCSRGEDLAPYLKHFGISGGNRYIGVEASQSMAEACRERFAIHIGNGLVEIRQMDLRTSYPTAKASLTLSILTTQFIPMEYRQRVIERAYAHKLPGGALLIIEKVLGATADIDELMVARYYDLKAKNGYSRADIERKRASLEGVLVPLTAQWNEQMLSSAGFSHVDCFWRWMNFAGWVAIKDGRIKDKDDTR